MSFTKYFEVGKLSAANSLVYIMDFFANALFIALILFIFTQLWRAVYSDGSGIIEGFTLPMMIWYLVMTESIVVSPGHVVQHIGDEIQSGNIAHSLNKPYNFFLFKYASSLGNTWLKFLVTFGMGALVAFIVVGPFDLSLHSIPFVIVSLFLALTLHFSLMAFFAIFAFWLEDAKSIHFIYQKLVFVLGGMLLPLEIFPQWLETISKSLPFSYIAYFPAKLWVSFSFKDVLPVLLGQIFWISLMIILTTLLYKICIKKISINGG